MLKEIDKLKMQLQTETLLSSKTHNNYNDPTFLTGKIDKNTNNLMYSKTITQETVNRDKLTAQELEKQGNQLMDIHHTIGTAEENLTLKEQVSNIRAEVEAKYLEQINALNVRISELEEQANLNLTKAQEIVNELK